MDYLKNAKARLDEASNLIGRAIGLEKLSTIERDIILAKLASAYEIVLAGGEKLHSATAPEVRVEPTNDANDLLHVEEVKPPKPEPAVPAEPPLVQPQTHSERVSSSMPTATPAEVDMELHSQGEILSEKFQAKQKFRNEIIAEHASKVDMATKLQNKPVGDLAKAIGINDKFLFIKELFDGDAARYSETIQHLNTFSDLNDAIIFLQDNFQWAESNAYALKFIDLIRRKFI